MFHWPGPLGQLPSPSVAPITLRLATPADAEQIREIYNHEVMHTVATFDLVPRTLAEQQEWQAARSGAFATIVAVDADSGPGADVVGFGALSPDRKSTRLNSSHLARSRMPSSPASTPLAWRRSPSTAGVDSNWSESNAKSAASSAVGTTSP